MLQNAEPRGSDIGPVPVFPVISDSRQTVAPRQQSQSTRVLAALLQKRG
jgi:hypothetical protein